jgi:hypothetical protein
MREDQLDNFKDELEELINKYSLENGSNTPDFILAEYLTVCLLTYNETVLARSSWYGRHDEPGQS